MGTGQGTIRDQLEALRIQWHGSALLDQQDHG